MEDILISIIIPIYNSEKNIYRCVDSIIKQSLKNIEIILIDDGSTDSSLNLCMNIANNDYRIRVLSQENLGVSIARNNGINMAKGKYIMFCDSDDFVERVWCEELFNIINKDKNVFALCGITVIDNRYKQKSITEELFCDKFSIYNINKKDFLRVYQKSLFNSPCNKIYLAQIIKENNIRFNEQLSLGEDLLFNLEYMKYINEIKIVNKTLYNYTRMNEESLDNKYYENLLEIYKYLYKELYRYLEEFEVDISEYEEIFYTGYFYKLIEVLNNTFNKKCKLTLINKIKYNSYILKSSEFKLCIEKANIESGFMNDRYIDLLKSGKYIYIYIYTKLSLIKRKVKKNKVI